MSSPDDLISVVFDGVELFAAPFSAFDIGGDSHIHILHDDDVFVLRIDEQENLMYVSRKKAVLCEFDPSNGVDVQVQWGNKYAIEHFQMASFGGGFWKYSSD